MTRRALPRSWRPRLLSAEQFDWRECANAGIENAWIIGGAVVAISVVTVLLGLFD